MAHESFADPDVAELLNRGFVAIKVDREERPDVDAVYMAATQAMTGQGGWPMTVFVNPQGQPFFCGTYFPKAAFVTLLEAVGRAWRDQRDALIQQGVAVVQAITSRPLSASGESIDSALLDAAAGQLATQFDQVRGGFGGAPKFPPHMCLLFLLRQFQRTGERAGMEMVAHTAEQMARGGLYDQLAGGFARYSVDAHWLVPHFEKMLYDNALLLRVYTQLWRLTGDPLAQRVARAVVKFLRDDLATAEGGFASGLDADTGGVEGLTYVWTAPQLVEVLGPQDGAFAADLFGVTPAGTFEHGSSVLRLTRDIDTADGEVQRRWRDVVARLAVARAARPQPMRDDKVVAAWNGLAIVALVEFGFVAAGHAAANGDRDDQAEEAFALAVRAAQLIAGAHLVDGRLRRVSRDGLAAPADAVLEDYGAIAEAFCAVHQLTGDPQWLRYAGDLLDTALDHFGDGHGGFYDTADDAPELVTRPADPTDNATPSGRSALCAALVSYSALTGEPRYRQAAQSGLAGAAALVHRHIRFAGYAAATAEALVAGPHEIAVADPDPRSALLYQAWWLAPPGAVIVWGEPDQPGVPLLRGRPMRDGQPTAYVCRGFVCQQPVTTAEDLAAQLTAATPGPSRSG